MCEENSTSVFDCKSGGGGGVDLTPPPHTLMFLSFRSLVKSFYQLLLSADTRSSANNSPVSECSTSFSSERGFCAVFVADKGLVSAITEKVM